MLRIALCDDEGNAKDFLRIQLEKIMNEDTEQIVYEFSSGEVLTHWLESHPGEIDLLFLDVEMKKLSGIDAARQIRAFNTNLMIVFVTGYPDFVFDGYRVQALDYLVKPASLERLTEVMERVRKNMAAVAEAFFSFRNTEGLYRLSRSEIQFLYSEGRKVILTARDLSFPFYGKLNQIEETLGAPFVRIHQRYLVNSSFVEKICPEYVTIGDRNLPISRSLKDRAMAALAKDMLRGAHF